MRIPRALFTAAAFVCALAGDDAALGPTIVVIRMSAISAVSKVNLLSAWDQSAFGQI